MQRSKNNNFIKIPLFLPNSTFIVAWSILFSLLIIFYFSISLFVITFRISFENDIINGIGITIAVLFVCLFDTLISINTCFIRSGKLIRNNVENFRKYFGSWMVWFDFIVVVVLIIRLVLMGADKLDQGKLSVLNLFIVLKFFNIHRYQKRLKFYYFREYSLLVF